MIKKLNHQEINLAEKLVLFVLQSFDSKIFIVETAVENTPACDLYLKLNFRESKRRITQDGFNIIRFEKRKITTKPSDGYTVDTELFE